MDEVDKFTNILCADLTIATNHYREFWERVGIGSGSKSAYLGGGLFQCHCSIYFAALDVYLHKDAKFRLILSDNANVNVGYATFRISPSRQ